MLNFVGWFGSVSGLLGSLLLALNNDYSGWGFVAFLISNAAWLFHVIERKFGQWFSCSLGLLQLV